MVPYRAVIPPNSAFCRTYGEAASRDTLRQLSGVAMPLRAKFYIALILASGLIGLTSQLLHFAPPDQTFFWFFFLITVLTSGLKVRLPMVTVTLSVNFLFILVAIARFTLPEALAIAAAATVVQCVWQAKNRPRFIQVAFSTNSICLAVIAAHAVFHGPLLKVLSKNNFLLLALTAAVYFIVNTVLIAGVVALTENKSIYKTWYSTFFWAMQYHLAAAMVAWQILILENKETRWQTPIVLLALVSFVYRQYKIYLDRLEHDKHHVEEIAGLHLRTIEALALAIEAKDATTHDHLQRVRVYATEIGREIKMSPEDLDALQAAALLHDIGKLAVPEHIISKPGKLTPEEFEKMKIHPLVGAEILEEVKFPYPVVPIVRAHHEKWDGSGYPFGLAGEEIPIGARILSAVYCLDALASDRQYRRALPLDEAMKIVVDESGKAFDPVIVDILKRRYIELERIAVSTGREKASSSRWMSRSSAVWRCHRLCRLHGDGNRPDVGLGRFRPDVNHRRGHAGSPDLLARDVLVARPLRRRGICERSRNDSVPVSTMSERKVSRSTTAPARRGSLNTLPSSLKVALVATATDARSSRSVSTWNKSSAPLVSRLR